MNCGIYRITCKSNGKFYVGSSRDLKFRWQQHRSDLRHNRHRNDKLQHSFNKYGEENFLFEVIETCSEELLLEREQYFIDTTSPWFNLTPTAGSNYGWNHSDDTKKKISDSTRGVRNHKSKLSEEQIAYLRSEFGDQAKAGKAPITRLSLEYGVSGATMYRILHGFTYTDVK